MTWVRLRGSCPENVEADTQGPDAVLTPLGEEQAQAANAGWKEQLKDGVPLPQTFYTSPLRRSASTLDITWKDIVLDKGVRPIVSSFQVPTPLTSDQGSLAGDDRLAHMRRAEQQVVHRADLP